MNISSGGGGASKEDGGVQGLRRELDSLVDAARGVLSTITGSVFLAKKLALHSLLEIHQVSLQLQPDLV